MEKDLLQILKEKGFVCDTICKCKVHQIKKLGLKEWTIPNLKDSKRIGVVKMLSTRSKKVESEEEELIEKVETETTVLKKRVSWYEIEGIWRELVVVLEESEKILIIEEIDEDNLDFIKFFHGENKELNEYRKKVILIGIKSLLERGDSYYWDKTVYFLYGVNSTGKSGGVALLLSFFSAYYEIEIPDNFAVTGKIDTHNGNIKKIGGLKSKIIQAIRNSKIKDVILPQENHKKALKILDDYHKRYSNSKILNLYPVSHWKDLINLLFQWKKIGNNTIKNEI